MHEATTYTLTITKYFKHICSYQIFLCVYMYVSNHFNHCIKLFAPCGPLIGNKKFLSYLLILSNNDDLCKKKFIFFSDYKIKNNNHITVPAVIVLFFLTLLGLSIRGGTRYFYPPKMIFGTSYF